MPRVTRGTKKSRRRAKILKLAKGYWGARSHNYRTAKEAVERSLQYSYRDRRTRKRDFRRLWVTRISAAAKIHGMNYSTFMNGLKKSGINLDRKALADIAARDMATFEHLVEMIKA